MIDNNFFHHILKAIEAICDEIQCDPDATENLKRADAIDRLVNCYLALQQFSVIKPIEQSKEEEK